LPFTIPAFVQYQSPMFPLRGLWNRPPVEGDQFVNAELDWLTTTNGVNAVQFSLSGNSPVALSQIVSLSVDNGRCGVDVDFIFPDSGFVLTVAAHNQGLYPVFTNALMFYASAPGAAAGDITILQILNSVPPPVQLTATSAQNHASLGGIPANVNGPVQLVAAGVSGTLNTLQISVGAATTAAAGAAALTLTDGAGHTLWQTYVDMPPNSNATIPYNLNGLALRFVNGLVLTIAGSTLTGGYVTANAFYTAP